MEGIGNIMYRVRKDDISRLLYQNVQTGLGQSA